MAFDQATRNRLQRFVSDARKALTEEFTRQLQNDYGLDPVSGTVTPIDSLRHLDDARRETARILRDTLAHYLATSPSGGNREALDRIVCEQAFTVLNRLAALRMAEARGLLIESLGNGYNSKGFQLYARLAGTGLGETGDAYRCYLFSVFDEFALDLKVLFDRFSPYGRLFPREAALLELLALINGAEIAPLWAEDETIGWIYQYFNSKDERKKMRDESSAPRNSRELAVRNQFFTPRYVVEFLTDNTLGRIWYEMTRGETRLQEQCRYLVRRPTEIFLEPGQLPPESVESAEQNLSQEELLRQPVYILHRPLKDPREIRVLDPACGSMHFGLYAFDLLETIYEEAWDIEQTKGADAFSLSPEMKPLHEIYSDKQAFLRDVPRLVVEHNVHGIDIDPRAVQIAGLSLWLRAQRAWQEQQVKSAMRLRIRRSNIVCAEPMPGEETLLQEFIDKHFSATAEGRLLGQLVRRVFEAMRLAGEAGSLLKIEAEIADDVAEAKQQWLAGPQLEQVSLFAEMAKPEQQRLGFDVSEITDETFWEKAEERIYAALRAYAVHAENGGGYQRRLFADDAARGFAFIDICRKSYDVVLMNPPFGWPPAKAKTYQDQGFPKSKNDLYCVFVERMLGLLRNSGLLGSITSRTAFFLSSMRLWREEILLDSSKVQLFADFGFGVLDGAFVETAAFVVQASEHREDRISFFRLNEAEDKSASLLYSIENNHAFELFPRDLRTIPGSPFSYWVSRKVRQLFVSTRNLEHSGVTIAVGLATSDNERFLRTRWEVSLNNDSWKPFPKGGDFAKFHQDIYLMVDWEKEGAAIKAQVATLYGTASRFVQNTELYFKSGLTYPRVSVKGFGVRILPAGCIFSDVGQGIFADSINEWLLLGLLNSDVAEFLMRTMTPSRKWEAGFLKQLPFLEGSSEFAEHISMRAQILYHLALNSDLVNETTSLFRGLHLASAESLGAWMRNCLGDATNNAIEIQGVLLDLNKITLAAYGLTEDDIRLPKQSGFEATDGKDSPEVEDESDEGFRFYPIATDALSFMLGCIFSRWDIRYATGEKPAPELPDPFAPLPVCPPGMLQNAEGLPTKPQDVPDSYPLRISWPGILVDDKGHLEDIEGRLQDALHVIWKGRADAIESEACEILGVDSLREYFHKPTAFFAYHLKRYSKSRRQAPIYWPLSTRSGAYTLWLYYHRLNDQTLYICINNFVEPKLNNVSEAVKQLRTKSGRSRDDEKKFEQLQSLELELQDFRDELLRLARLPWRPNLNDGVQINAAPLWKLFRLPKWQKILQETWQKLEKREYDWAHLAMTIWPEHVVPKCVKDRSFAIAHEVEELFWVEDSTRWRNLQMPSEEVQEQKKRQRTAARERVKKLLTELAANDAVHVNAEEVCRHFADGDWDDREVALKACLQTKNDKR